MTRTGGRGQNLPLYLHSFRMDSPPPPLRLLKIRRIRNHAETDQNIRMKAGSRTCFKSRSVLYPYCRVLIKRGRIKALSP